MYVPNRTPGAHQVAASQGSFKGCHVYLESGSDCRFWRFFVNERNVMLHACHGWPDVVNTIKREASKGIICLGIIDNDFRSLINYPEPLPDNVFTTDDHDVEMMVLKTAAAKRVATHYDASGKIMEFERKDGDLIEFVFGITDSIGLVKLANKKAVLNMVFKKEHKDQTLELPNYENFLDKTCHFTSDEKMISYLHAWSTSQQMRPSKSVQEIKDLVDAEKQENYDTMQLSNGHDACYILAYILKNRIVNKKQITQEKVEELLSVAYSPESLKKTALYKDLYDWSQGSGIQVLKV